MKNITLPILITILLSISCKSISYEYGDVEIRVAAVGDSITYGFGISDKENNSYPEQLEDLLGDDWGVVNFGVNGATVLKDGTNPYWKQKQFDLVSELGADIVILKLGTNDSRPANWEYSDNFYNDYIQMINHLKNIPGSPRVIVCTPVPAFSLKWNINDDIIKNEIIPIILQAANDTNVEVIDLYNTLLPYGDLFPDTIHPDSQGAAIIAQTVYNYLLEK